MSRLLLPRISKMGATMLSRPVADLGQMNWPKCALCMRAVDAYGIEAETAQHVEVWASCSGVRVDPASGAAVAGAVRVHEPRKGSVHISKLQALTFNQFVDIIRRMAFFAPVAAERNFAQDFRSPDTVKAD